MIMRHCVSLSETVGTPRSVEVLKSNDAAADFLWRGGDWTTKYAPWARGEGFSGPRGLTPPASMWVLSAENFYYGAFYMLSQLGINLEGQDFPTGTNCWTWELDPVEGTAGWSPGNPLPGNLNMEYTTDCAQASGCMPVAHMSFQANGMGSEFKIPEDYRVYCQENPSATGCQPWKEWISWSGGSQGSHRFENLWDEPYVFAIVIDAKGYWTYRWRPAAWQPASATAAPKANNASSGTTLARDPDCKSPDNPNCNNLVGNCCPASDGMMLACCGPAPGPGPHPAPVPPEPSPSPAGEGVLTGWPGVERFRAARRLPPRPAPVKDPRGLRTDVPGDVTEAVILQMGLTPEASCLRSSIEAANWQFGANALAAMAHELQEDGPTGAFAGSQNWWTHYADTKQNAGYPLTIAGVPSSEMTEALNCNRAGTFTCSCEAKRRDELLGRGPSAEGQGAADGVEEIVV